MIQSIEHAADGYWTIEVSSSHEGMDWLVSVQTRYGLNTWRCRTEDEATALARSIAFTLTHG